MNIMVGPDGNVYAGGTYQSAISLTNSVNLSGSAGFVAKFDTAGLCQWAQKIVPNSGCGCTTADASATVRGFDQQGNMLVSGFYCGCGADFGNGITTSQLANTMYIAKFN